MVTMSRQAGSGGDEIARLLAEDLGWTLLDNQVVEKLLADRGFHSAETDAFEERKPDFWHRFPSEKERYLHFLKLVSYEFAREAGCVILGRGGQVLFAGVPGIVRVRIIAPLQDRVARMVEQSGGDEHGTRRAIQHSDSERAGFHRFLFHVDWDSPDLYDMVMNTHAIPVQAAAGLVAKAIGAMETAGTRNAAARRIEDLFLAQKATVAILYEQKLPIRFLEVDVQGGSVTLRGSARDQPSIERSQEVASRVTNAKAIQNEIRFDPRYVELLGGIERHEAEQKIS